MLKPQIGAHISVSGGIKLGIKRGEALGAECIQIFAGSPRRYEVSFLSKKEEEEVKETLEKKKIYPVFVHASYLLNLASEDEEIKKKSIKSIKETLRFISSVGFKGTVYHPGSPKKGNKEEAVLREIESIKKVLENTPENATLILENTAGKKKIGTDPEEIGFIFKKVNSPRLKLCIDTAHSLESGNIKKFDTDSIKKWLSEWEQEVGLANISLLHVNDSATTVESQHDRHENIGEGYIGRQGFVNLMKISKLREVPWILEVPGFDKKGPDKKNIDILKKIREERDS